MALPPPETEGIGEGRASRPFPSVGAAQGSPLPSTSGDPGPTIITYGGIPVTELSRTELIALLADTKRELDLVRARYLADNIAHVRELAAMARRQRAFP